MIMKYSVCLTRDDSCFHSDSLCAVCFFKIVEKSKLVKERTLFNEFSKIPRIYIITFKTYIGNYLTYPVLLSIYNNIEGS